MNSTKRLCRFFSKSIRSHLPASALAALLWAGVVGFLAVIVGQWLDVNVVGLAGLGITTASLFFALVLSILQGRELTAITEKVHRVLFNDVTLRVFYNIQENEKLSQRMHEGSIVVKDGMGNALRAITLNNGETDFLGQFIIRKNVFIESGSTYAYLALAMNEYLNNRWEGGWKQHTVFTNNILVFMVLIFQWRCWARLYPGTPAGKYGATYGRGFDITDAGASFRGVNKDEMEHFLVGRAQETVAAKRRNKAVTRNTRSDSPGTKGNQERNSSSTQAEFKYGIELVLLAASKLHLTFGPHVGSEENVCFKLALLDHCKTHKVPILMMIDSTKIEGEHEDVGKQCRMLFPEPSSGAANDPYELAGEATGNSGKSKAQVGSSPFGKGFELFVDEIAEGNIFLFVGYSKTSLMPSEIVALEKRIMELNNSLRTQGRRLATCKVQQSKEVDLLAVFAQAPCEDESKRLSNEIQLALAARVCQTSAVL